MYEQLTLDLDFGTMEETTIERKQYGRQNSI